MKNILYITYDGLTDPLGQSQILPYVKELSKAGYSFTILSFEKKDRFALLKDTIEGLCAVDHISWHPITFHTQPPVIAKIYDRWLMKNTAIRLHQKKQFSLIHCRSYPGSEVGLYFKKKLDVPFLFDMRGFWADEKVDSGHWNLSNIFYRKVYTHYKVYEKLFLAYSSHIISLTQVGKEELIKVYGDTIPSLAEKITVIPTCADLELFNYHNIQPDQKRALADNIGTNNKFVISYSGSVGGWYLIDEMLQFFKVIKDKIPNAIFLCLTKEPAAVVTQHFKKNGLSNQDVIVTFAQRKDLPLYLSLSNYSVFFIRNTYSKMSSSPTKYPELMGLGIPVICNSIGDTQKIVLDTQSGILIDEFNNENYKIALETMLNTTFDKEQIRAGAQKYFALSKGVSIYTSIYNKFVK